MLGGIHPGEKPPPVRKTATACQQGGDGGGEYAASRDDERVVPRQFRGRQKPHSQNDRPADEKHDHQQAEEVTPETREPQPPSEFSGGFL